MSSNSDPNKPAALCEFQDNLSILRQINFFSGLPIELLKVFAYLCTREVFKPGQTIFNQGDDDGRGYFIISGTAELIHEENGREQLIKTFGQGAFLGILALLGSMPRHFSLRVAEQITCLVITRTKFSKAVERFPEIMPKLIRIIVNHISVWEKRTIHASSDNESNRNNLLGISLL